MNEVAHSRRLTEMSEMRRMKREIRGRWRQAVVLVVFVVVLRRIQEVLALE